MELSTGEQKQIECLLPLQKCDQSSDITHFRRSVYPSNCATRGQGGAEARQKQKRMDNLDVNLSSVWPSSSTNINNNCLIPSSPTSTITKNKIILVAPKPVPAFLKQVQPQWLSPIKSKDFQDCQKNERLTDGDRRDSSEMSQSDFLLSEGSIAARRINFQNEQNLSCIIQQDDEPKNRSNSPLKDLQSLLDAENELNSIFNKKDSSNISRSNFFQVPQSQQQHQSPDARTAADQSFSTSLSCSSYQNKTQSLHGQSLQRNNLRPPVNSQYSFSTNFCSNEGSDGPIKRVSCNPFKKNASSHFAENLTLPEEQNQNALQSQQAEANTISCNLQHEMGNFTSCEYPGGVGNAMTMYEMNNYSMYENNLPHHFMFASLGQQTTSPAAGLLMNSAQMQQMRNQAFSFNEGLSSHYYDGGMTNYYYPENNSQGSSIAAPDCSLLNQFAMNQAYPQMPPQYVMGSLDSSYESQINNYEQVQLPEQYFTNQYYQQEDFQASHFLGADGLIYISDQLETPYREQPTAASTQLEEHFGSLAIV